VKIIILATDIDEIYLHELIFYSVKGCCLKDEAVEALLLAIHTVALGAT
jgi:DNA-binding NarL/FixJ family response regulator